MTNFPPGVTGNEPEIAGHTQGSIPYRCDNQLDATRCTVVVGSLGWPLDGCGVDEIDCPFDGWVDGEWHGATFVAECPVCGNTIEAAHTREDFEDDGR